MNKGIGIALLVVGIALIIYGFNASDSVSSNVSRAFHRRSDRQNDVVAAGRQRVGNCRRSDDLSPFRQGLNQPKWNSCKVQNHYACCNEKILLART
jgi:hypothetical protein